MTDYEVRREELLTQVMSHADMLESYFKQLQGKLDPKAFGLVCRDAQYIVSEISQLSSRVAGNDNVYYPHIAIAESHVSSAIRQADSIQAAAKRLEFALSLAYHELGLMKAQLQAEINSGPVEGKPTLNNDDIDAATDPNLPGEDFILGDTSH